MLAGERRTERELRIWIWILLLAPLAGLAGIFLEIDRVERDQIFLQVSRPQSERIARNLARQQGIDVQGWSAYAGAGVQDQLSYYYRDHAAEEYVRRIRRLAPAASIQVSLIAPDGGNVFRVRLATDGRVLGFSKPSPGGEAEISFLKVTSDRSPEAETAPIKTDVAEAEQLARSSFTARLGELPGVEFRGPDRSRDDEAGRAVLKFSWRGGDEQHAELRLLYTATVRANRLVGEEISAELSQEFADEHYPLQPWYRVVASIAMGLVAVLLSFYALFLYFRRSRQGEVSHRRNMLLGLLIAISFTLVAVLGSIDSIATQLNKNASDPIFLVALVAIAFAYAFVGLYCGLMWGSGEGEVREAFPGKLTSLDALVLGRWFSRNVASSVVVGTALGMWLLLVLNLCQLPWRNSPQFGPLPSAQVLITYLRYSGLLVLLTPLVSALPVSILGLLVPVTCAWRWIRSGRKRILFLGVLATLGCFWFGLQIHPFPAGLATTVVTAGFLMVSFLYFDLLATIATISAWNAISNLITLGANTSYGLTTVVACSLGFGIFLLIELYFSFHGKLYSEVEVRPLYAEHLAQRQALEAEISAAREAQLRLAPQVVPDIEGLRIAAVCRPSRTVGGDFYDFFRVGETRLGIFLAEGGNGGLSAALSIAYAKGILLPMVNQRADVEQMIGELERQLEPLRKSNPRMGILLAILDLESGTLQHGRLGDYPRLLIARGFGDGYRLHSPLDDSANSSGIEDLLPEDRIICFTDGMSATLEASQSQAVEDWLAAFFRKGSSGQWLGEFEQALQPQIKKARQRGVEDDVSTILLHFEQRSPTQGAAEEVA